MITSITPAGLAETLLWGVANGCIYILLATGLNLIFGVMKLVNFAHGQLLMVGAFVAYEITTFAGLNPYASILVSMGSLALIGIVIEKFAFRKVRGTEKLNEIFISLGLIYVFQNIATLLWVENYNIRIPSPLEGLNLSFGAVAIGYDRILAMVSVVVILIGLLLLTKKTKIGLAMRATSQKSDAAMLMGININRVYLYTFAVGAALAGAAGALYGILFPFNPAIGALPTIKAFAIIILGGLGSIPGAVIGGLLYGIAENTAVYMLGGIWQDAIAFALLIAVLVIRPTGLFGEKGE
ncbi:MAG: branched-chain amino acid ABC transporter permease [Candidatus Bathyarchaeota archaeon]|nr:branched-chain amino acid ABC transporter permease [Candidatus Bathyarchaeota archaeon]